MKKSVVIIVVLLGVSVVGFATRTRAAEKAGASVSLEIKDAAAAEALAQLLKVGNAKYSLDESAKSSLKDAKVTASFKDVDFEHAVDALASALQLSREKKSDEYIFKAGEAKRGRVVVSRAESAKGKGSGTISIKVTRGDGNERAFAFSFGGDGPLLKDNLKLHALQNLEPHRFTFTMPQLAQPSASGTFLRNMTLLGSREYTCQHCKRTSRIQTQMPAAPQKCPKCQRSLQSEFKFCPFDGMALPGAAAADEPKYCPYCGKDMGPQPEKSSRRLAPAPKKPSDAPEESKLNRKEIRIEL